MTTLTGQPLASLTGSHLSSIELGIDDPRFTVVIADNAESTVYIEFVEPLAFHKEREPKLWSTLVDRDGSLTAAADARLVEHLGNLVRERISDRNFSVDTEPSLGGDEDDVLGVSYSAPYAAGETFAQWWVRIGWPIIAETINVTDPGTHNAPYLLTDFTS
ncbi:hypothetical protein [Rhodococcus sp. BS-15]|uniref:hypothetical protein n=1 Tax=Rhodococcus sp. BS-15 TaxID=1304954 RepID=UPI000B2A2F4E|nr:hypothetical protein [Rhodococcus sp. BS-15]